MNLLSRFVNQCQSIIKLIEEICQARDTAFLAMMGGVLIINRRAQQEQIIAQNNNFQENAIVLDNGINVRSNFGNNQVVDARERQNIHWENNSSFKEDLLGNFGKKFSKLKSKIYGNKIERLASKINAFSIEKHLLFPNLEFAQENILRNNSYHISIVDRCKNNIINLSPEQKEMYKDHLETFSHNFSSYLDQIENDRLLMRGIANED